MSSSYADALTNILEELETSTSAFDALTKQLVWRIGQVDDASPVVIRVGLATSTSRFATLPRLKNASDHDLEKALATGNIVIEWVGPS